MDWFWKKRRAAKKLISLGYCPVHLKPYYKVDYHLDAPADIRMYLRPFRYCRECFDEESLAKLYEIERLKELIQHDQ